MTQSPNPNKETPEQELERTVLELLLPFAPAGMDIQIVERKAAEIATKVATHYKAREAEIRLDFAQAIMFTKVEALFDDGELFQQWQPIEQTIINQVGYESFKALQEAAGNLDLNKDSKS